MSPKAPPSVVTAEFVAGASAREQLPAPTQVEVAFAGRSNVGKSSLMNRLLGRRNLVRTGSTPGTTRQINFFSATLSDGLVLMLVDLPGYGYAKRSHAETARWGTLIESYLHERPTLRSLVVLVDARRGIEDSDRELLEFARAESKARPPGALPVILVATKMDRLALAQRKTAIDRMAQSCDMRPIGFSAVTGDGVIELWHRLRSTIGLPPALPG